MAQGGFPCFIRWAGKDSQLQRIGLPCIKERQNKLVNSPAPRVYFSPHLTAVLKRQRQNQGSLLRERKKPPESSPGHKTLCGEGTDPRKGRVPGMGGRDRPRSGSFRGTLSTLSRLSLAMLFQRAGSRDGNRS